MDLCRPWNSLPRFFTAGPRSKRDSSLRLERQLKRPPPKSKGQATSRQAGARDAAPYKESSHFGEFPPFERRRDRAAHQQLRQSLGRLIQFVNALADELVVAASHRLFKRDRKSTRLNSSHVAISYAVSCLK